MRLTKMISTLCCCGAFVVPLSSCNTNRIVQDYGTGEIFETALNNKEDTVGKTICFIVDTIKPNSAFGFNI